MKLRRTLGVYGPKYPDRSGVANYIDASLRYLESRYETRGLGNQDFVDPNMFDHVLYHLGNNSMHEGAFAALRCRPGPVILHEYINLDYYYSFWEGLPDDEQRTLLGKFSEAAGRQFADRDTVEMWLSAHPEIDRYSLDIGSESIVIDRATTVLVHNNVVSERLQCRYPHARIIKIPFPVEAIPNVVRSRVLHQFTLPPDCFLYGTLGFVGEYKRVESVLAAWENWTNKPPNAYLCIVGEVQYNIALSGMKNVLVTGYVSDSAFEHLLASVDCAIQLRGTSLGETSGVISRLVAYGQRVIVSDIAEMRVYSGFEGVSFIPTDSGEVHELIINLARVWTEGHRVRYRRPGFGWADWMLSVRDEIE